MRDYGNFGYAVSDLKWFDELQLNGWDFLKQHLSNPDFCEAFNEMSVDPFDLPIEFEKNCKQFHHDFEKKTGLEIYHVFKVNEEMSSAELDCGQVVFLVDNVVTPTVHGLKALSNKKVKEAYWVVSW